jgi:hypothetical protein
MDRASPREVILVNARVVDPRSGKLFSNFSHCPGVYSVIPPVLQSNVLTNGPEMAKLVN